MKSPNTTRHVVTSHSFLLIAHYATFAYQDLLFDYLTVNQSKLVTKINLPLPELPFLKHIEITHSEYGKKAKVNKINSLYKIPVLAYMVQSVQLLWLVMQSSKKYDMVIAEDSLLAFLALILRFLGKCKVAIFYSHGIDKKRFGNTYLNYLYQLLDKTSATQSNFNWFLNSNMRDVRVRQGVADKKLFWIPASIAINTIPRKTNVFNHKIVFLGVLSKKNGANLLPQIMLKLKNKIPDATLDIIGEGELSAALRNEVKTLHLEKQVKFYGLLKFKEFAPLLTHHSVGIAPYEDDFQTLSSSSDPMKMRIYLAAGLPVVITRGFNFSDEIATHQLGLAVDFKVDRFVEALVTLLTNKEKNLSIRKRALAYSKQYDIIEIYDRTFKEMLRQIERTTE